jgi:signal transduction histidine kinase/BarA-like signal transduction histidine kinase
MRAMNWSTTPVGPPEQWPQSLRSTVSMLLPSKAQIILFWGAEFVVFYNDAYRPVFGAKHPHALGLPGRRAWSEIWDSQLHELLAGVVRTGEAFWARDLLFQLERYDFLEETYFDVSYDPVRVESGAVGGVFCIVTETTERVVGQRRMALLRDLAARNATARTAREACVLAMDTLAAKPEDVPFALAYLDDELQSATPEAEQRLAGAKPDLVKTFAIASSTTGGRTGRLIVGLNPRRPFDEDYRSFLELVADQLATALANARAYEEERQRADALAAIDRAKTAFFSNVSHEFRTPLTLMLGPIEKLLADVDGSLTGAQRNDVEILQRNAGRLSKLVNALLDFSRLEAGRATATYAPTDISTLTGELAGAFRSAIEHAGIEFDVACEAVDAPVYVDRDMWEKIVLNLLSNALKFTFAGSIRVELRQRGEVVELAVADTGTGIPRSELSQIFERFHRVEGAKSRTHEGTGIGLALTHELVRLHGGTVDVESEVDRGSRFVVQIPTGSAHLPQDRVSTSPLPAAASLIAAPFVEEAARWLPEPAADDDRVRSHAPASEPRSVEAARLERVLVADDNADMREYLRQLLRQWEVATATNGRAALEMARLHPPDLIVTDVMMPELDGFALLRELRSDTRTQAIPVLMLSARAGEEARVSGLDAGADDYIVKPFTARELIARVRSLLNLSRARAAAETANRTKDEFLAMLGHELRNPLAPIVTALQLMTLKGGDTLQKERTIIDRQVRHLARLVDDLLDVSRIARGKVELRRDALDLADVVTSAVEAVSPLLEERQHQLVVSMPDGLIVTGDVTRLTQIVTNILSNAAKYTKPHGTIEIDGCVANGNVELRVKDNGIGISPEMLPSIFDMFTQERQAIHRADGGLGLGLTIAKSLVELHGGTIGARSDGIGHGCEIAIRIPALIRAGAAGRVDDDVVSRSPAVRIGRRILVVDDNADAARTMADALSLAGYDTRVSFDGPAALDTAANFQPDAVLLDIGLPLMDGYEVAGELLAASSVRKPILVAVTGYGQVSDQDRTRAAGFSSHVVKPIDLRQLMTVLESLLTSEAAHPGAP